MSRSREVQAEASDRDWKRLGDIAEARRLELGLRQIDVVQRGGPSVVTIRLIESAAKRGYRAGVLRMLENALDWKLGSVSAILQGDGPTAVRSTVKERSETVQRLRATLTDQSEVPDSEIMDLVRAVAAQEGRIVSEVMNDALFAYVQPRI